MAGRSVAAFVIVALAFSLLLLFSPTNQASAVSWKIHYNTTLVCDGDDANGTLPGDPDDNSCASPNVPGASADVRSVLNIDSSLDGAPHKYSNFATVRTLNTPPEWNISRSSAVPDGLLRGRLTTAVTLSILNGPCTTLTPVVIPLFDATTNINDTVTWLGGGDNLLLDPDNNGMPAYIDKYPDFLLTITDPDKGISTQGGAAPAMKPMVRLAGHAFATPGAPSSKLEFLIFEPGSLTQYKAPYAERDLSDSFGYVNVVQLDNPEPGTATPSSITEFCEPLLTDTRLYGKTQGQGVLFAGPLGQDFDVVATCAANPANPGCGTVVQTNPAADTGIWDPADTAGSQDTHLTGAWSISNRDADADGINNNEDGCPFAAGTVDTDNDGVEDVCDPVPGTANADMDGDGFQNRQDNCPKNANVDQADSDVAPASDGGGGDGIGDVCDPHPFDATTEGPFVVDFVRDAICLGTDTDGDGWCDDAETKAGSNPGNANSLPEYKGLDPTFAGPPTIPGTCSDLAWYSSAGDPAGSGAAIDNDADTLANAADTNSCGALPSPDSDGDGILNANDNCATTYNPEQLNTDGDAVGDACDPDDDNDGLRDRIEMLYGGQPKVNARYDWAGFGYDLDGSTTLTIADVFYYGGGVLAGGKTVPQAGTLP